MGKDTRSRKWLMVVNNPVDQGMDHARIRANWNELGLSYACMCDEIGEEGTYHTHIFIQGKNQIRFSTVKNRFPGAHIEMAKGTAQENRDYCTKEGKWENHKKKETNLRETFEEMGECPVERPGRRTDLENLYEMIQEGKTNKEILDENPRYMMNLDKIERARQVVIEAQYRDKFRPMHVEYHWGVTGTGKTRGVMEKHGYANVYRVTNMEHPWDGYRQQPVVLFEEMRSNFKIQDMLNWLDGYPLELPCRYANKIACFTHVYITTNIPLEEQYPNVQKEQPLTWEAFLRRIHVVKEYEAKKKVMWSEWIGKETECKVCPF